jgi:hypothetical protein
MPTRILNQQPKSQRSIKAPTRQEDWKQLLRKAIQQAENSKDRRLEGLRNALANNQAEKHLKKLGIIHEGDIKREFFGVIK